MLAGAGGECDARAAGRGHGAGGRRRGTAQVAYRAAALQCGAALRHANTAQRARHVPERHPRRAARPCCSAGCSRHSGDSDVCAEVVLVIQYDIANSSI